MLFRSPLNNDRNENLKTFNRNCFISGTQGELNKAFQFLEITPPWGITGPITFLIKIISPSSLNNINSNITVTRYILPEIIPEIRPEVVLESSKLVLRNDVRLSVYYPVSHIICYMNVECELPLLDIKEIVIPSVFNTNHKIEIKNGIQNENKTDDENENENENDYDDENERNKVNERKSNEESEIESIEESERTWVVNITALHGIFLRRISNQNITIDKKLKFQIDIISKMSIKFNKNNNSIVVRGNNLFDIKKYFNHLNYLSKSHFHGVYYESNLIEKMIFSPDIQLEKISVTVFEYN